jgi:hypothetical protein
MSVRMRPPRRLPPAAAPVKTVEELKAEAAQIKRELKEHHALALRQRAVLQEDKKKAKGDQEGLYLHIDAKTDCLSSPDSRCANWACQISREGDGLPRPGHLSIDDLARLVNRITNQHAVIVNPAELHQYTKAPHCAVRVRLGTRARDQELAHVPSRA